MAQSYRKRFEGREQEIRRDVKLEGYLTVMDKYEVKDLIAWEKYITELFNGQTPPASTVYARSSLNELYGHLGAAVFGLLVSQQTEIKRLRTERQSQLEMQDLEQRKLKSGVLEAMKYLDGMGHELGNSIAQ